MAFSGFGAPAPGGAPAPAPAGGAFSFNTGNTAAPAAAPATTGLSFGAPAPGAATGAAPTPAAPAPAFSFATGAPTAAPTPATTTGTTQAPATGINFGGGGAPAAAATPAAAPATTTPAPAAGFSFSSTAPATGTTPAPAATTTFGATIPAPSATPAPAGAFGGFSATPAAGTTPASTLGAAPATAATPAAPAAPTVTVQDFEEQFPYSSILSKVKRLLPLVSNDQATLEWQELFHILQCQPTSTDKSVIGHLLSKPPPLQWNARNDAFRSRLQASPTVLLQGKTAGLTPEMIQEIWQLADDLRITEESALCLYAQASDPKKRRLMESKLQASGSSLTLGTNVPKAARELFFYEHSCALTTVLLLLQQRLQASSDQTTPNAFLVATDQLIQNGLVENLISLVREYTLLADNLENEWARKKANMQVPAFGGTPATTSSNDKGFLAELLDFVQKQRQMASECLFYLTYHTQCTPQEVASLIDIVKELTNGKDNATGSGLPILDPFKDIPSAFENDPNAVPVATGPFATASPFAAPVPAQKEKDPLKWREELIKNVWESGGKPQLLKCVSVLIMSIICALDGRQTLMDRARHGPNQFGVGNALLPPTQTGVPGSTDDLLPIHSRLDPKKEMHKDWKRKDIWGLLAASYALLLLPVEIVSSSPRNRSRSHSSDSFSPRRGQIDVKATWRACLEAPTEMQSFSFARLSLVPSFAKRSYGPDCKCNNYEFYMSVLSEFVSKYLDVLCASGNVPISREQWKSDEEMELQVSRAQRDQDRKFGDWSGTSTTDVQDIPNEVDLLGRPDCMDDVMALAVTVCSTGPTFALNFWSVADEVVIEGDTSITRPTLVPSRAMQTMELLVAKDESLRPAHISFLGALALAQGPEENPECSGAAVIHKKLSAEVDNTKVSWYSILYNIGWYAKQLNTSKAGLRGSTETMRTNTSSGFDTASTAYYYGADQSNGGGNFQSSQSQQTTTTASAEAKPTELGEANQSTILSHLALISSVASQSSEARADIAAKAVPISDGVGGDHGLTILFSMAIAPVSPEIRGAVFVAISNILREPSLSSVKNNKTVQDMVRKGWDLLEESQIIPIGLLDQYAAPTGVSRTAVMGFPLSSTAQVATGAAEQFGTPWTPPDTRFGIMYEMEHVESRQGVYPSTEGLLHLLTTLVMVGGCPADLGRFWRPRSGCSPYVEYVIHFVLPRALGTKNTDQGLPFRNLGDKSRLVCLALELVEAVLSRYVVPSPLGKVSGSSEPQITSAVFGLSSVAEAISIHPNEADQKAYAADCRDELVSHRTNSGSDTTGGLLSGGIAAQAPYTPSTAALTGDAALPLPKSPGFAVLVDILSSLYGDLFKSIVSLLTQDFASRGMIEMYGDPEYYAVVAASLFGRTSPSFHIAKQATNQNQSSSPNKHALLKPPFPAHYQPARLIACDDASAVSIDGTFWRERSVSLALRILCAAAIREDQFSRIVNGLRHPMKIVPVLRLHRLSGRPSGIRAYDVQVSRLVDLLKSSAGVWDSQGAGDGVFPTIMKYLGYVSPSWKQDAEVSSPAVALMLYADRMLPALETVRTLCGASSNGGTHLAVAVARRLKVSSTRVEITSHADIVRVILNLLVSKLRGDSASDDVNISHIMLGLPKTSIATDWDAASVDICADSFDVIVEQISRIDFVRDSRTSKFAATAFEILFCLVRTQGIDQSRKLTRVLYAAQRLRGIDFWYKNLLLFMERGGEQRCILEEATSSAADENGSELLHCVSWLLKGVSNELRLLMGVSTQLKDGPIPSQLLGMASPRPTSCRRLLSLLFAGPSFLAVHALNYLPLIRKSGMSSLSLPLNEVEDIPLQGPADVVAGYFIISIDKLRHRFSSQGENEAANVARKSAVDWAKEWNLVVTRDCAVSHFADALRVVFGSSFVFCGNLLLGGGAPLDRGGVLQYLSLILSRLTDEMNGISDSRGVNDALYHKAALEMARVALVLVEEIAGAKDSTQQPQLPLDSGDAVSLYVQLSTAVAVSSKVDGQTLHEVERTVLLGRCLALISEAVFRSPNGLHNVDGEKENILLAASALARIASKPVSGSSRVDWTPRGNRNASMIRTARSSLSTLLTCHENDDDAREESLVFKLFKMGPARRDRAEKDSISSLLSLVTTLDDDVYNILSSIALCRFGAELLHEAGLLAVLERAAQRYTVEEGRVRAQVSSTNQHVDIRTPSFLSGHFSLLNAMLSTRSLSPDNRQKVAEDAKEIIRCHIPIVERLILSFPTDGDVVLEFTKCLYLVSKPRDFDNPAGGQNLWQLDSVKSRSHIDQRNWAAVEKLVLELTYHVSQYPFPRRLLPVLPAALNDTQTSQEPSNHVVSVSNAATRIWWDAVENRLLSKERNPLPEPPRIAASSGVWYNDVPDLNSSGGWSDQHYEFCIQASRILDSSLSFLNQRVQLSPPLRIDCFALAKGFCRCADSARAIEGRLRTLAGATSGSLVTDGVFNISMTSNEESTRSKQIELEYLSLLGPIIGRCAEKFLVLTLSYLRGVARESMTGSEMIGSTHQPKMPVAGLSELMLASLDHTQVETMGVGCIGYERGDEKKRDFAREISKNLRKELQGEMKMFT